MSTLATVDYRIRALINDSWIRFRGRGKTIATHWYRKRPNFGDMLAPFLLECIAGRPPTWVSEHYRGKVISLGSLLHRLLPGDVVWGAGSIRDKTIDVPGVRYLAVRGPLTRNLIRGDVPEVYGDPAVLLPRFYQPRVTKRFEIGVIPHYMERDLMTVDDPSVLVIDPLSPWRSVVDMIAQCHAVISSSLHGIIVAEAFGVTTGWTRASDRLIGGSFKFRDYYMSTDREIGEPVPWENGMDAVLKRAASPGVVDVQGLIEAWVDPRLDP